MSFVHLEFHNLTKEEETTLAKIFKHNLRIKDGVITAEGRGNGLRDYLIKVI